MSRGYVESHVGRDVVRAYERMLECPGQEIQTLVLPRTPWFIARQLRQSQFAMSRLVIEKLNGIFKGENGRAYGAVLGAAPVTFPLGDIKSRTSLKRYRFGPIGPHKIVYCKKGRLFRRAPPPEVVPVGFEEVCYHFDPRDIYRYVYFSLQLATESVLNHKG